MVTYPGIRAMQKVAPDISRMDQPSAERRPMRSPNAPQKNPPNGRTRNEIAKIAKVAMSATCRSESGKKTCAMVAARYPYTA